MSEIGWKTERRLSAGRSRFQPLPVTLWIVSYDIPPPYVSFASLERCVIHAVPPALREHLATMGLTGTEDGLGIEIRWPEPVSFEEAARMLCKFRDLGIAFSAGRDWSPSEVMRDLHQRGLCEGSFTEIEWTGPSQWRLAAN